jgi:hypothetical protein
MSRTARQIGQQIEVVLKGIADLPAATLRNVAEDIAEAYFKQDYSGRLDEFEFIEECCLWSDIWTAALKPVREAA